jgi:hypothetical protein
MRFKIVHEVGRGVSYILSKIHGTRSGGDLPGPVNSHRSLRSILKWHV